MNAVEGMSGMFDDLRLNTIMKCQDEIRIYPFAFILTLTLLLTVSAQTPPGDSGVGIMALGGTSANYVSINAPDSDIPDWVLNRGTNEENTGMLQVSADGDWKVTATDSSTTTNGHMTEWDGSDYISGNRLASPMSISIPTPQLNVETGYEVALTTGGKIADGPTTNSQAVDVHVTFKQPVSSNDQALTDNHRYRITVKFTISPY